MILCLLKGSELFIKLVEHNFYPHIDILRKGGIILLNKNTEEKRFQWKQPVALTSQNGEQQLLHNQHINDDLTTSSSIYTTLRINWKINMR